ncbi:MAG: LPS export ABC transporter permease LptG [Gammaproteobacteria bacterium]
MARTAANCPSPFHVILDRYLGWTVANTVLVVAAVLITAFTFFEFLDELDSLGGRYGLWQVLEFCLLRSPGLAYKLFPIAALIGSLIALGGMVASRELTVIRASGVSIQRTVLAVMKGALGIVSLALVVGELVVPHAEEFARQRRAFALYNQITFKSQNGFWIRDGRSYINIRHVLPGDLLEDIFIFEFDTSHRLTASTYAKNARYQGQDWLLFQIEQTRFHDKRVTREQIKRATWRSLFKPELINMLVVEPETLAMLDLVQYIRYLKRNAQSSQRYEQALWVKLAYPLAAGVMVLLAVPLVLSSHQVRGVGHRILLGSLIGMGFHICNQAAGHLGVVYSLNPGFIAILPTATTLFIALVFLRRIH